MVNKKHKSRALIMYTTTYNYIKKIDFRSARCYAFTGTEIIGGIVSVSKLRDAGNNERCLSKCGGGGAGDEGERFVAR